MTAMLHLAAGRYGPYVWPAYAVTALVIAVMVIDTLWRAQRWKRAAGAEEAG